VAGDAPQRSCLGCRSTHAKGELLRFVLAPDRTLVPDLAAKLPGRGAYTCMRESCLRAALAKRQFSRSFRGEVHAPPPDDLVVDIGRQLEERIGSYLALANKAGKVVSGSDLVMEALRKGTVRAVLLAADVSPEIGRKISELADRHGIPWCPVLNRERLAALLGKELRSTAAIGPGGFIAPVVRLMTQYRNFFEGGAHLR